jgi:hypothetical protein
MALNRRGWTLLRLRCAATPFGKLFNRTAASSSGCTSKLFVGGKSFSPLLYGMNDDFSDCDCLLLPDPLILYEMMIFPRQHLNHIIWCFGI